MTMLSTTGEHVVYVIMFWLVQLEVSLCEDMFGSLDGKTSLAYPRSGRGRRRRRRLLPNVAHEWCRKTGVRWLVARAGLAAGTYASSGFWRGLQFYRTGVPGDVVEGTYGVSLKHFTTNLFGMAPRLRARVLACSERFLGASFLAVTLAFEGLVWVLVVGLEVALVALPPGGRRDAAAACQAWTNFMVLGMFFGAMSFVVAVVLLYSPSALDDAVDEASPGSHAYALANVLALAVASYHCREVFPFNANGLFSYATCHATLLSTAWALTDATTDSTELALLIVGPGQSLEARRENRRPCRWA
ncbi:phosphoglycerate mutase [Aureococcus anophagefferens]|nr:phosphoglycerate mutase [Aureococcus anophagefferens]